MCSATAASCGTALSMLQISSAKRIRASRSTPATISSVEAIVALAVGCALIQEIEYRAAYRGMKAQIGAPGAKLIPPRTVCDCGATGRGGASEFSGSLFARSTESAILAVDRIAIRNVHVQRKMLTLHVPGSVRYRSNGRQGPWQHLRPPRRTKNL